MKIVDLNRFGWESIEPKLPKLDGGEMRQGFTGDIYWGIGNNTLDGVPLLQLGVMELSEVRLFMAHSFWVADKHYLIRASSHLVDSKSSDEELQANASETMMTLPENDPMAVATEHDAEKLINFMRAIVGHKG